MNGEVKQIDNMTEDLSGKSRNAEAMEKSIALEKNKECKLVKEGVDPS